MPILRRIYRYRGILVAPPLIVALILTFHKTETGVLTWTAGTILVLLGTGIRVLAQQHIHHRIKAHQDLTTTGPYSVARNPLYAGNILICLGATVTSKLLWFTPITLLYCFVLYSMVVRYEEARLLDEYGEPYRKYLFKVPRWFPKTLRFRNGSLVNPHFLHAVAAESPCLLILIPYIIKDIFT